MHWLRPQKRGSSNYMSPLKYWNALIVPRICIVEFYYRNSWASKKGGGTLPLDPPLVYRATRKRYIICLVIIIKSQAISFFSIITKVKTHQSNHYKSFLRHNPSWLTFNDMNIDTPLIVYCFGMCIGKLLSLCCRKSYRCM